jgi:radical SAM superfamily enzyme YgiQ (UPF0313 family)
MRALLINARSDFAFWTLRESIVFSGSKALSPPLGLITAAALLPEDWELRLVDRNIRFPDEEEWEWAEIVLVSGMLGQRTDMLSTVREARRRGKLTAVGGPYPTSLPRELLDAGADSVVSGEGEMSIPLFLDALKTRTHTGIIKSPERPDMQTSPVPRFDLLNLYDYQILLVQTSRGCPFECEFCDIINLLGRKPRYKSPDQVIVELRTLFDLGWRGTVFVGDDNFIGSRTHALAILEKLIPWQKSHGEPFGFLTQASVNLGKDLEMIDKLTEANFSNIFIGLESPDTSVLENAHKFQNVRNPIKDAVETINKNGLVVLGSFIVGFDNEEPGVADRMIALVEETAIPIVMVNMLNALPNTKLWDRLEKEGRLLDSMVVTDRMTGDRMNFVPSRPEADIFEEMVRVWDELYEPKRFYERTSRYFRRLRPTRAAMGIRPHTEEKRVPPAGLPWKIRWRYLKGIFRFFYVQGIRPPYRAHFWRNLLMMVRENPSRIDIYLQTCGLGENMFHIREMLLKHRESYRTADVSEDSLLRRRTPPMPGPRRA